MPADLLAPPAARVAAGPRWPAWLRLPAQVTMNDDAPSPADPPVADVDAALARRAAAGDDTAFEVIVVKYQRRLAAVVRRSVRDERIVEELVQEVFLRAHAGLGGFRPDGPFAAWLFTIARNVATSYLRSAQNRQDDRPLESAEPGHDDDGGSAPHAVVSSPEDEAIARQLFAEIDAAMAALPETQRQALLMREVDGLDYAAIAHALSMPLNTLKSHIHRARDTVARRIRPLLAPSRGQRW